MSEASRQYLKRGSGKPLSASEQYRKNMDSGLDVNRLEGRASRAYKAAQAGAGKAKEAAAGAARAGIDAVGGAARFLGSALSTPKAALIHAVAGTKTPVRFSPTASQEQIEEVLSRFKAEGFDPGISSGLADVVTDLPFAAGMNAIGRHAVLPVARAIGEPLRRAPVAKQVAEFVKTGSSLPKQYRQPAQDILRAAEGEANLASYRREGALGPFLKLPEAAQDAVQEAVERRAVESLPDGLKPAARALEAEYAARVAARRGVGGRPHVLGSHLTEEQRLKLQAFTDRPMTREMRKEAGIKGFGEARALSTGGLKYRTEAGRHMTTGEINAMLGAEGKQRIAPVVESAMSMGAANDRRVMNLRIVNDLTRRFGKPTLDKGESVARHEGVTTGMTKSQAQFLANRKLPPEVDELVARLNKRMRPEEYNGFAATTKAINDNFKKWALFSPGFSFRNWQNNAFQVALFEDLGPKEFLAFGKAARPDKQFLEETIRLGVSGGGMVGGEIAKGRSRVFETAREVNQYGEDVFRRWLYLIRRGKGDTPMKAASRVDDILFNYSPRLASPTRKHIGRHYVPFVNWSTFIPGLTARAVMERPGSVALAGNIRERQNRAMGETDESLGEAYGPWNLPKGVTATGQDKAVIPQFAGQYSVNEMVPSGIEDAANKLASKLYPQFNAAFGLAAGRDTYTGKHFYYDPIKKERERFTTAPSVLRVIFTVPAGAAFAKAHGISIDPDTKKVIAPAKLAFVLGKFPQARIANIVSDWAAGVKGKEETLKSFGLGVSEVRRYEPKR